MHDSLVLTLAQKTWYWLHCGKHFASRGTAKWNDTGHHMKYLINVATTAMDYIYIQKYIDGWFFRIKLRKGGIPMHAPHRLNISLCSYIITYPGVHGEKQPKLRQFSLDPLDLIRRERLSDGDLMEVLNFTEEAENWLRRFNEVNEHRLKAVATEIVEGILRVIL